MVTLVLFLLSQSILNHLGTTSVTDDSAQEVAKGGKGHGRLMAGGVTESSDTIRLAISLVVVQHGPVDLHSWQAHLQKHQGL